jgi:hypothetical protein
MSHIPPILARMEASIPAATQAEESIPITTQAEEPKPITIEGEATSITITLPQFYEVNTSMRINLSERGGIASVQSEAAGPGPGKSFKSKIYRIELVGVQQQGSGLVFIPTTGGRCTVKIFFEHP